MAITKTYLNVMNAVIGAVVICEQNYQNNKKSFQTYHFNLSKSLNLTLHMPLASMSSLSYSFYDHYMFFSIITIKCKVNFEILII